LDGLVPYDAVLASRRRLEVMGKPGCSFAVVALAPDAPPEPPFRERDSDLGAPFSVDPQAFFSWWRVTPDVDAARIVTACEAGWGEETARRLGVALLSHGSWVAAEEKGVVLHVHSPFHDVAARLRLGA
jgi:hypothetical protein